METVPPNPVGDARPSEGGGGVLIPSCRAGREATGKGRRGTGSEGHKAVIAHGGQRWTLGDHGVLQVRGARFLNAFWTWSPAMWRWQRACMERGGVSLEGSPASWGPFRGSPLPGGSSLQL